ncbi:50S ribosome-binding GTPase [Azotobacter beijerinckii]|uniref:50S ribosome-binding GTPase n=1 Tax=Azotobacter beijerinckii TaxID=170623 RepID=A0A1H6VNR7_9GAMM|nr:GTPase [Azotobacter beijerinckii]SEJ04694.1 50S ribosome-binding GTPase [Azotobacter beijerinckii]
MTKKSPTIEQLEDSCHSFLQEASQNPKPVIAAWGLVKAGKSSLLNMLSGHIEDEFFKTGVVRTTRLNQELETDHYLLMDTPGLGIDQADSRQAYSGLDNADVVLFVHAPPGELDQEEMELLTQLKATYAEDTEQRLVLVLSQLDKDQDGALERIRQRIQEQLQERFGIQPKCFLVSNSRYRKGAAQGKQTMIDSSGIPQLAGHLDGLVQGIDEQLESVRASRRAARKAELLAELERTIAAGRQQVARLQQPHVAKVRAFNRMMSELRQNFAARTAEITAVQKELNSL